MVFQMVTLFLSQSNMITIGVLYGFASGISSYPPHLNNRLSYLWGRRVEIHFDRRFSHPATTAMGNLGTKSRFAIAEIAAKFAICPTTTTTTPPSQNPLTFYFRLLATVRN
jgi:hypothetical protein